MDNLAIIQITIPILGSLSNAIKIDPLLLMIPTTLASSFAFLLFLITLILGQLVFFLIHFKVRPQTWWFFQLEELIHLIC
jgi:di/tricarboxylate transporter